MERAWQVQVSFAEWLRNAQEVQGRAIQNNEPGRYKIHPDGTISIYEPPKPKFLGEPDPPEPPVEVLLTPHILSSNVHKLVGYAASEKYWVTHKKWVDALLAKLPNVMLIEPSATEDLSVWQRRSKLFKSNYRQGKTIEQIAKEVFGVSRATMNRWLEHMEKDDPDIRNR